MPGCEGWDRGVPEAYLTPEAYERDMQRWRDEVEAARTARLERENEEDTDA